MRFTIPRRKFFVTAGLAAGGALSVPLSPLTLAQARKPSKGDPVLGHVGKEMARLYKRQRSGPFYAEHFETLAANLRLLAISAPDIREAAKKPFKHDHKYGHAKRVEEVRQHLGLDISGDRQPPVVPAAEREKIRAQFAREGLAPTLNQMAALAEARAGEVARNGNRPEFRTVQYPNGWNPWCSYGSRLETAWTITCDIVAPLAVVGGVVTVGAGVSVCVVATITFLVWDWWC